MLLTNFLSSPNQSPVFQSWNEVTYSRQVFPHQLIYTLINPKNIPGKDVEAGLGLLQRTFATKDSGLAYSQATPAHFSLLTPGWEKQ